MRQSIADALDTVQATGQQAALLFGLVRHSELLLFFYFVRSKVPRKGTKGTNLEDYTISLLRGQGLFTFEAAKSFAFSSLFLSVSTQFSLVRSGNTLFSFIPLFTYSDISVSI